MRVRAAFVAVLLTACTGAGEIRIGTKTFTEQRILGRLFEQVLEDGGIDARVVSCGGPYECDEALRSGSIDMMVEYVGTALSYVGAESGGLKELRQAYGRDGLTWLDPIGFDNGYLIVTTAQRAAKDELTTIADLARLPDGIRFACSGEFTRRARDGLGPLKERYGFRVSGEPILVEKTADALDAVLSGRADAGLLYGTDPVLEGAAVHALSDSLRFWPSYEGAVVVHSETLKRSPRLLGNLNRLTGRINTVEMRKMNHAVEIEGRNPAEVAWRFLAARQLLQDPARRHRRTAAVIMAVPATDRLDTFRPAATRILRTALPQRAVDAVEVEDPIELLATGRARLALVGAERMFALGPSGLERTSAAEAVAVVGRRAVHVLRRRLKPGADPLSGNLGIAPPAAAAPLAAALHLDGRVYDDLAALERALEQKKINVALFLAEPGDEGVAALLQTGNVDLYRLQTNRAPAPFLRPARIPADSYPRQPTPVATLAAQVVLAAPATATTQNVSSPVGAASPGPRPLSAAELMAITSATGSAELPDPSLRTRHTPAAQISSDTRALDAILNLLALAFLAWLGWLTWRREPTAR